VGRKKEIGTPAGDEKQQGILDAAAAVFMKQGFAATSLDDISDNYGGASKGIIYYHFRSKTNLFFAVQRRAMELTRHAIAGIATGDGSPRVRLERMSVAHTLLMMEHLDYLRVAAQGVEMQLGSRTTEEERREIASVIALRDSNEKLYLDVIQAGVKSGDFRKVDPRIAVKPLLGALNWTSRWYHPREGETPAQRLKLAEEIGRFAIHAFLPERALKVVR
jgi:AcrR family transcriptional regulator